MDTGTWADLLKSRKFWVTVIAVVAAAVLAGLGKMTGQQAMEFIKWVLGAWLVAHAGSEVGRRLAVARQQEFNRNELHTLPATPSAKRTGDHSVPPPRHE